MYIIIMGVVFVAAGIWALKLFNTLPRDVIKLKEQYQEKEWQDFSVDLIILLVSWTICIVLLVTLIFPVSGMIVDGYSNIMGLLKGFMF
ncbi:hypothetical protein GF373_13805 [bacterium]|nr:hypothetical protein [bacterium]